MRATWVDKDAEKIDISKNEEKKWKKKEEKKEKKEKKKVKKEWINENEIENSDDYVENFYFAK